MPTLLPFWRLKLGSALRLRRWERCHNQSAENLPSSVRRPPRPSRSSRSYLKRSIVMTTTSG